MVSFSLCKLMAGASISVSKTKALKALIPTECMQVDQNVCKCSRAPCLLIDLSSFSSTVIIPVYLRLFWTMNCQLSKHGTVLPVLPACWPGRLGMAAEEDNGLVTEQYSRGFLVGGGSVKPRYGLFSVSNLRLYFCLPPRTRSRRTPGLQTTRRTYNEESARLPD